MSDYSRKHNRIVWSDIPVINLQRAVTFYHTVLAIDVAIESYGDVEFAVLAHNEGNGACLVVDADSVTDKGALNYFNVHGRLKDAIDLTVKNGGKVLQDLHAIGPFGYRALVLDSEGNKIALHSEVDS